MSVKLLVMRHGETKLNSEERLRGHMDIPLNAQGIKEAEQASNFLSNVPINRVYASSLDRADHTAQIVAKPHNLKPILREWFTPIDFGKLNGQKLSDIGPELDRITNIWKTDPEYEAPGGESFKEFQDRNLGGLHAILKTADDDETILLVAHLRNAILYHEVAITGGALSGNEIEAMDGKEWEQGPGSVSHFEFDQEGAMLKYIGMFFEPEASPKEKAGVS